MTLQADAPAVLITALSGRALAACARRGGFRPLVADLFGDLDTQDLAEASERVPGSLARGFARSALLAALDRLAEGRTVVGVVTGAGFEDRPGLLRAIGARYVLLGNAPATVAAIKDPFVFAATCARAGISHPPVHAARPNGEGWLRKRVGGSGGRHVVVAPRAGGVRRGRYYQRRVAGEPVSATFLAGEGSCRVLGFSRQWAAPTLRRPFRYGGAVRPAPITAGRSQELCAALTRLVPQTGLRGLNSADFLMRDDGFDLLEVNPRPGAALDIFADKDGALFGLHVRASAGVVADSVLCWPDASAAAVVYAPADIRVPRDFVWPDWTADRQPPGDPVPRGAPLCTVLAEAADAGAAEACVRDRALRILARITAGLS